jgi:hypothetical protein
MNIGVGRVGGMEKRREQRGKGEEEQGRHDGGGSVARLQHGERRVAIPANRGETAAVAFIPERRGSSLKLWQSRGAEGFGSGGIRDLGGC